MEKTSLMKDLVVAVTYTIILPFTNGVFSRLGSHLAEEAIMEHRRNKANKNKNNNIVYM